MGYSGIDAHTMGSSEGGTSYQYQYNATAGACSTDGLDGNDNNSSSYYGNDSGGHSNMSVRTFDTSIDSRLYSKQSLLGLGHHHSESVNSTGEVSTGNAFSGISKSSEALGTTTSLMDAVMGRKPAATEAATTTATAAAMNSTSTAAASAAAFAVITTTVTAAMETAAANNVTDAPHLLVAHREEDSTNAVARRVLSECIDVDVNRGTSASASASASGGGDEATNPEQQQQAPAANEQVTPVSSSRRPKFQVGDLVVSRV
jgi:hypothetical protein